MSVPADVLVIEREPVRIGASGPRCQVIGERAGEALVIEREPVRIGASGPRWLVIGEFARAWERVF